MSVWMLLVCILTVLWCPVYWIFLYALIREKPPSAINRFGLLIIAPVVPLSLFTLVWLAVKQR